MRNKLHFGEWTKSVLPTTSTMLFKPHQLVFLLVFSLSSLFVSAQNWSGNGAAGDWNDPLNWDVLQVPVSGANVSISPNNAANYPVIASNITTGVLNVQPNAELSVTTNGSLTINGNSNVSGSITIEGSFTVNSTIIYYAPSNMVNNGTATIQTVSNAGAFVNNGTLTVLDNFSNLGNASFTNGGTTNTNAFSGFGSLTNEAGAIFTTNTDLGTSGPTINDGEMNVTGVWTNVNALSNRGEINVSDHLINAAGHTFTNEDDAIITTEEMTNYGLFLNKQRGVATVTLLNTGGVGGTFHNLGSLTVILTVDLKNTGTFLNEGSLNLTGAFQNFGSGVMTNKGDIVANDVFSFGGDFVNQYGGNIEANTFINTANLRNEACATIAADRFENGGGMSFTNSGKLIVGNLGNSNPGLLTINNGVIFDNSVNNIFLGTILGGFGTVYTTSPDLGVNATTVNSTYNGSTGSINLTVSGAIPPYSFSWNNGSTSKDLTGIAAGTYTVEVSDSDPCGSTTETLTVTVGEDAAYCSSKGNSTQYEYIKRVSLGDIYNYSGDDHGYGNYTDQSTDLTRGNNYSISLKPGFKGYAYYERWKVWIDFNQDGDFDDYGEEVYQGGSYYEKTGYFNIPNSAATGETRMRVSMKYGYYPSTCQDFGYGEVEDYTVNITGGQVGGQPGGQVDGYCTSKGNSTKYEHIASVQFGSINNTSGNNGGYGNYTSMSTDVLHGQTYNLHMSPAFSGKQYIEKWRVWIDWNQDGDFNDYGERVYKGYGYNSQSGHVTVPQGAATGNTRMRVSMKYGYHGINSCGNFGYGEVEDYTIHVVNPGSSKNEEKDEDAIASPLVEIMNIRNIYPMPATDVLNIDYFAAEDGTSTITIYDMMGRMMQQETKEARTGQNSTVLDVTQLVAGTYILEVNDGEFTSNRQIIIQ
ncbi:MAG: GEVED domain-containing protein [Chitinophagales bacterium]